MPGHGNLVLEMLRRYRSAETAMLRRARSGTGLGESDLLALRFLMDSAGPVGARELALHLGISPASVTILVDRLVARGFARREPHPTDRRAVLVVALSAGDEFRDLLTGARPEIIDAADAMNEETAASLVHLLELMIETLDGQQDAPNLHRNAS